MFWNRYLFYSNRVIAWKSSAEKLHVQGGPVWELGVEQVDKEPQNLENFVLWFLGQFACCIWRDSETLALLFCWVLPAWKPEAECGPSSLNIVKFLSEDLVAPVNVVYQLSPWILGVPKPGVPLKPWLQSLKPTVAHPFSSPGPLQKWWVVANSGKKKCSFFESWPSAFLLFKLAWILRGCFGFAFLTNWNV